MEIMLSEEPERDDLPYRNFIRNMQRSDYL